MIWPFLFALLVIIFGWRDIYEGAYGFLDHLMGTVVLGLFSAFAFGFGIFIGLMVGNTISKHWVGPETVQLVSLRDSDGIDGSFFLGTGSVGTTQYYFFYMEAGQGYQPGKVEVADNVLIYEEERQNGELRVYTYKFVNQSLEWVAIDWLNQRYEFIIPKGSLKKNFVLQ